MKNICMEANSQATAPRVKRFASDNKKYIAQISHQVKKARIIKPRSFCHKS
jgi:hypothetical protein